MPPANHTNPTKPVSLNDHIAVYWPLDDQFFSGVVTDLKEQGKVVVHYHDGDVETLSLSDETWKFAEPPQPPRPASLQVPTLHAPALPLPLADATTSSERVFARQGTAPNTLPRGAGQNVSPATPAVPASRKRRASPATIPNPVSKRPVTRPHQVSSVNNSMGNTASLLRSTTAVTIPHSKRTSPKSQLKPAPQPSPNRTTAQTQLARPITSGVPLSGSKPPPKPPFEPAQQLSQAAPPNFQDALEPLMTSFNAQLNTQVSRISSLRDMLLNFTPRFTELDQHCKTLRADVDNLESEVTSRAEMNKLLNDAFVKQMDELNRSQTVMLQQLKTDFRAFLQDEMRAVEKHLVEQIRTKSAEVFKELFRGVAESIKDPAVKNAIEDMSAPTCPSKNVRKK